MPRLFMHLQNGNGVHRDERGEDYPSEDAALAQAARSAGSMLSDDLIAGHPSAKLELLIERDNGSPVARIEVSAIVSRF